MNRTRITAAAGIAVGVIAATAAPATAASGNIRICSESPGASNTSVRLENNYTLHQYTEVIDNVSGSDPRCRGEGTSYDYTSEPEQFHISAGYCGTWQANNGPWAAQTRGGSGGAWVWIHPGEGYGGTWAVDIREWDC